MCKNSSPGAGKEKIKNKNKPYYFRRGHVMEVCTATPVKIVVTTTTSQRLSLGKKEQK